MLHVHLFKNSDKFVMEIHLRTTGCRLPYGITQWKPCEPATRHKRTHPALTSASEGWYSIYLPRRDGRLSWLTWLATYRDGLRAHGQAGTDVIDSPYILVADLCFKRSL